MPEDNEIVTPVEISILVWLAIGLGVAAGVFVVARSAVQLASVAYRVMEKQLDARRARRETTLLSLAMLAGLIITAVIAGYAILFIFATLLDSTLSGG